MNVTDWKDLEMRVASTIKMRVADEMMYHVMDKEPPIAIWLKLESWHIKGLALLRMTKKLLLKKTLYDLKMVEGSTLNQHINVFN